MNTFFNFLTTSLFIIISQNALSESTYDITGKGYGYNTFNGEFQKLSDGSFLQEQKSVEFYFDDNAPEIFPGKLTAECDYTNRFSKDMTPTSSHGVCIVKDIDNDGFIALNGWSKADYSDLKFETYGGWGKYKNATVKGIPQLVGLIGKDGYEFTYNSVLSIKD